MIGIVFGMVLPWLLLALGAWLGYQHLRQNGPIDHVRVHGCAHRLTARCEATGVPRARG